MKREFNVRLHMNILKNGSVDVEFLWIGENFDTLFKDIDSIVQSWQDFLNRMPRTYQKKKTKAKK